MISLNLLPAPHYHLIGHRGAPKQAPENTLASFKRAAELGLNWIEFDVRLTKDDELVIFHDDKLERTTNGTGLVINHTVAELKQLDAGHQEKIPTLIETIPLLKQWHLTPVIEIKCAKNQAIDLTQKIAYAVADCLKVHWNGPIPPVSSFDHKALLYYRERLGQDVPIGFLVDDIYPEHIELAHKTPNSMIHCSQRYVTPQRIQTLQKENIPLFIFTVNDKALKDAYLEAGATAVFTDYPDRLI
jgi:glycerophosphoryl diester phosphodiesterase